MSLDEYQGALIHPKIKLLSDICPHTLLLYDHDYFLNSYLTTINFYKNHLKKSLKTLKLSHFQLFFKYLLVFCTKAQVMVLKAIETINICCKIVSFNIHISPSKVIYAKIKEMLLFLII